MLQLEINRLRTIIKEIESGMREARNEAVVLENIYKLKLEETKILLYRNFENELNDHKN
jgi:hypothetical protein